MRRLLVLAVLAVLLTGCTCSDTAAEAQSAWRLYYAGVAPVYSETDPRYDLTNRLGEELDGLLIEASR